MRDDEAEAIELGETREIARGVVVQRRSFLGLCAAAFGAGAARPALSAALAQEGARITLDEFLDEVVPVARELVRDTSAIGEDCYLHTLAAHAVALAAVAAPELRPSEQGEGVTIGSHGPGNPFVVLHWRMAPGSVIRLHAHTYGNVVTVGLEGRARVRNFETLEPPDFASAEPVRLRCTTDQVLTPGRINLVPLSHGFVHGFEAGPEGASGLDITTRIRDKAPTPYLDLEDTALDPKAAVFRGRWTG